MSKSTGNESLPAQSLWIYRTPTRQHSVGYYVSLIDGQLDWLRSKMTPDMVGLLERSQGVQGFSCKYCGEVFQKGCAIGGHISKRHPDVRERNIQSRALARKRRARKYGSESDEDAARIPRKPRGLRRAKQIDGREK